MCFRDFPFLRIKRNQEPSFRHFCQEQPPPLQPITAFPLESPTIVTALTTFDLPGALSESHLGARGDRKSPCPEMWHGKPQDKLAKHWRFCRRFVDWTVIFGVSCPQEKGQLWQRIGFWGIGQVGSEADGFNVAIFQCSIVCGMMLADDNITYVYTLIDLLYLVGGLEHVFIFHNIWDNPSHWPMFFKMVKTTNQMHTHRIT